MWRFHNSYFLGFTNLDTGVLMHVPVLMQLTNQMQIVVIMLISIITMRPTFSDSIGSNPPMNWDRPNFHSTYASLWRFDPMV